MTPRTMPAQVPGESKQDYGTPRVFTDAVVRRFGRLDFDLAAHAGNHKCELYFNEEDDALSQPWHEMQGNLWLNPPFNAIPRWAAKCAEESALGAKILFLVPSSVGANWYWDHVHGQSLVLQVGRMSFTDDGQPFPKDLMLCCYGYGVGFERWQWKPCRARAKRAA